MNENVIRMEGFVDAELAIMPEAEQRRDAALAAAGKITEIRDPFVADLAKDTLQAISDITKSIESARKEVKAPVLELTRKIDGIAKGFTDSLGSEKKRLAGLLGSWEAAERERIRKEKEEADRKVRDEKLRAEAMERAAKTTEEREQARQEGITKVAEAKQQATVFQGSRTSGVKLRTVYKFEVLDIEKLFEARPDLVSLEPRNDAIRANIKFNQSIPGLRIWTEETASV